MKGMMMKTVTGSLVLFVSLVAPSVAATAELQPAEAVAVAGGLTPFERAFLESRCKRSASGREILNCAPVQVWNDCKRARESAAHSSWTNAEAKPYLETVKKKATECIAKFVPTPGNNLARVRAFKAGLPILMDAERAYQTAKEKGIAARGGAVVGQGGDKSPMMERAHRVLNEDRKKYKALIGKMRAFWIDLKTKMKEQREAIQWLILSLQATVFHRAFIDATVKWATTVDSLIKMTDLAIGMIADLKKVHTDMKAVGESVQKGEWKTNNLQEKGEGAKKTWDKAIEGAKKMGGDASEFVTLLEKIEKSTQTEATGLGTSTQELDGLMEATDKLIDTLKADVKKKWIDPFLDDMKDAGGEALKNAFKPIMEDMKKLHLAQIPGYLDKVKWKEILTNFSKDVKDKVEKVIIKHKTKFKEAVEKYAKEKGKWSPKKIGRGLLGLAVLEEVKTVLMDTHRFWAARGIEQLKNNEAELQRAVDDAFTTDRNLHIMYRMVNNVVWSLEFHKSVLEMIGRQ